jgi:hypothetical protein
MVGGLTVPKYPPHPRSLSSQEEREAKRRCFESSPPFREERVG